eukprot:gnl/TRDRNA2_/TRDRNA2_144768_c0_seq2.p1 gnl/TRDRNA2_/TRDRNA2_144768_c0~~gnl/TRDRNA2_/TRDRNA2_144768_c0_seq2.p1  ORF type:complete len:459 (-),score=80.07 gnl/TRDRNA2_/TRDRNA2_144768_c0_seq2:68-1444(-)
MAAAWSEAEHDARVAAVFAKHDRNGSGSLARAELRAALLELGVDKKQADEEALSALLRAADRDGDGGLGLHEFASLFQVARLKEVFAGLDNNGDGTIDLLEMRLALRRLGCDSSEAAARHMFASVDATGDERIGFQEFARCFEFVPLASLQAVANRWSAGSAVCAGSDLAPPGPIAGLYLWQTVLAGGLAGVASKTATAPLERLQIAAQTGHAKGGLAQTLRAIASREGVAGLFAGNLANCLRVFPSGAIFCTTYTTVLSMTPADDSLDAMEPVWRLGSAAVAATVANTLTYPLDVARARLTVQRDKYRGLGDVFMSLVKEGRRGLFCGYTHTLAAVVPFIAIQRCALDVSKTMATEQGCDVTPGLLMITGGIGGAVAQTAVHPIDLVRRRVQVGATADGAAIGSALSGIRAIIRAEGASALFAGLRPAYLKAIPASSIGALVCLSMVGHFKRMNKDG